MLSLSPYDLGAYAFWYSRGWVDGIRDARTGRYILEAYGFGTFTPSAPPLADEILKRHDIEINHVAGCVVDVSLMGHAKGYNDVMIKRMRRNLGADVIPAAERAEAQRQEALMKAQRDGLAEGKQDVKSGRLEVRIAGPVIDGESEYARLLSERYGVALRRISAQDDEFTSTYTSAYNDYPWRTIERRHRQDAVDVLTAVAVRQPFSQFAANDKR